MSVYARMKNKHGKDTVLLFHVGNNYEAYLEDSKIVSETLGTEREVEYQSNYFVIFKTKFPEDLCEENIKKLHDAGIPVCMSEVRDDAGVFVLTN